jgi:hypothetical protein
VKGIAASLIVVAFFQSCKESVINMMIRLSGTNHILGHRLRIKDFPKPARQIQIPYLIIGGGISGLSAARQFSKRGIDNFLVVELESYLGGNSANGENKYSKFPLGAHYLPLPNLADAELVRFLEEEKIIIGRDGNGLPVFDEAQLVFSPQERLFFRNGWQEGLVPKAHYTEFQPFFDQMEIFRKAKGSDGKFLFDIPLVKSSTDAEFKALDKLSMAQWMEQRGFTAPLLLEYVNYCCRDDFGLGIGFVSAWAGIHYFAARKHDAASDQKENVLTWPEGNARLASHLKKYSKGKTLENHLVYEVNVKEDKVVAKVFDDKRKESVEIIAGKAIVACPQFVNGYLFSDRKEMASAFNYAPWLLATLTVTGLSDNGSYPLCWDNVLHGAKGLGYIYDQHQSLQQLQEKYVITYYHSFASGDTRKSRREMYGRDENYWKQFVLDDLKIAHPDIEAVTQSIQVRLLGHGMISPVPGFIFGKDRLEASQPIDRKIYFAHSDLAGISIFEEAFHQGINAVNQILDDTALDT